MKTKILADKPDCDSSSESKCSVFNSWESRSLSLILFLLRIKTSADGESRFAFFPFGRGLDLIWSKGKPANQAAS